MLVKYFEGDIKSEFIIKHPLFDEAKKVIEEVEHHFDYFEAAEASLKIMEFVDKVNKFVTDSAPWGLAKEEKWTECGQVLYVVLESMTAIASLIYPYCPNIAKAMARQLKYDINTKLDDINFENIKEGHLISKDDIKPVFLRLDSELADKKK